MKKTVRYILGLLMLAAVMLLIPGYKAFAGAEQPVDIRDIDYQQLNAKIIKNGNSIIYYSTDKKKTWKEVEGTAVNGPATGYAGDVDYILMDISWVSSTSQVTVYFKGDKDTKIITVNFPKQNTSFKVKFNKTEGDFTFTNYDDATTFMWRKYTDYYWQEVALPDVGGAAGPGVGAYSDFLDEVEQMRTKGGKICIRTGQTSPSVNTAADPGGRPSKEVTVSITKRANAPSVKINVSKLTLNTKDTMEYIEGSDGTSWMACEKNMELEDIAGEAFYNTATRTAGTNVVLQIRVAATEKKPYSKTKVLVVYAQEAPPTVGDSSADVTYYRSDDKTILKFNRATKNQLYEYCIVKPDDDSDKLRWKTVRSNKEIKLSSRTAPSGSTIYVREKGVNESTSKNIPAKLPSAIAEFDLNF